MKIHYETDDSLAAPEIIIRAPSGSHDLDFLADLIEEHFATNSAAELLVFNGATQVILPIASIIFIETESRQLQIHTTTAIYSSRSRLYELASELPGSFLQVSKSTIINLQAVSSLTKSISNCLVTFRDTHKTVYASRRYTKPLQDRLHEMR